MISSAREDRPGFTLAEAALALGALAIGVGEFASMTIVPAVAGSMEVPLPEAGAIVTAYALGVVVGSPVVTLVFPRIERRKMLVMLMLAYALANLFSAIAPDFDSLLGARLLAGFPHGAYFGVAALVAASLVPRDRRGRAIAHIMLGLTVANIFGVPLVNWTSQLLGWRVVYVLVAVIAFATCVLILTFVPRSRSEGATVTAEMSALRNIHVWLTLGVVAVGFGGMFAFYTYLTPILTDVTRVAPLEVPWCLALLGVGMTAGSLIGGRLADWSQDKAIVSSLLFGAATLASFSVTSSYLPLALLNIFAIGGFLAIVPAVQARLMDIAGPAQTLTAALNHSAFNVANGLGAWLAGASIVAGLPVVGVVWIGAALAIGGCVPLAISVALGYRRPSCPCSSP
ncbi:MULTISPECIES: MFS transporter [unclassified Caballeronia]|uniref:MFS transporter n=1 Tax=unclassified Caballeronia TaxID=2646786 RepID=UPI0020287BE1|nr:MULTISPECIES: MFS transporter [unclassified Caballeronia]